MRSSAGAPPAPEGLTHRPFVLVGSLVSVMTLIAVVSSLGAPLIPTIARQDHVPLSTAEWLLTGPLLFGALATPVMGRLADGSKQRRLVVVALSSVFVGCVVAAVATDFTMAVVGRVFQGLGLGLTPVTMAIARRHLPVGRVGPAVTAISATSSIGVGIGYPMTSLLAEAFGIRAAFWFGAAMALGALVLSLSVVPAGTEVPHRPFDTIGALSLSAAVLCVSMVLSEGGRWGWSAPASVGCMAGALVLGAGWARYELGQADPLVDLRQVRNRMVLTADTAGFTISVSMYLYVPVVIEYCQIPKTNGYGLGAPLVVSGLVLSPLSVCTLISSRCLSAYNRRFGTRTMVPLGTLIFAVSTVYFGLWHGAIWEAFVSVGFAGFGLGFTYAAMPGFIVRAVPREETGSATGFYGVVRSIGLSFGSALAAAILVAATAHGHTLPAERGFTTALFVAGGVCALTALVSFLLPGRAAPPGARGVPDARARPIEVLMEREAELAASGVMLAEDVPDAQAGQAPTAAGPE